jgi:hypothetical protein
LAPLPDFDVNVVVVAFLRPHSSPYCLLHLVVIEEDFADHRVLKK